MSRSRIVALVLLALPAAVAASPEEDPLLQTVQAFNAAFNAHDVAAMATRVADDVEWLSLDGAAISVEAKGKAELVAGMTEYFRVLPSARSALEDSMVSGSYVIVRERASWEQDGQERSQSSLAVYEIRGGLVARVWYFPVEP